MTKQAKRTDGEPLPVYCRHTRLVDPATLEPHPRNPNRHPEGQLVRLAAIIEANGWRRPIVVSKRSGLIVAGHARQEAAIRLGVQAPVDEQDYATEADELADLIADNRIPELAEMDDAETAGVLRDLEEAGMLAAAGFDEKEAGAIFDAEEREGLGGGGEEDVPPPPPPDKPRTMFGDVWAMGEHRVLCGDSTKTWSYLVLMGEDEAAGMVFTDPPYGVEYVGGTGLTIQNDGADGLEALLRESLHSALQRTAPGAPWYVAAPPGPQFHDFGKVLGELDVWRQTLVWIKNSLVMGRSDFHYRHEAIFYGWTPGAAHREPPDRKQDTVWEFDRPTASPEHPTMKPVALVSHAILLSSERGDIVLDPFGGSGTTALACESHGRRARLIEIDPAYCDVIVRRWQAKTGQKAVLGGTDLRFDDIDPEVSRNPANVFPDGEAEEEVEGE